MDSMRREVETDEIQRHKIRAKKLWISRARGPCISVGNGCQDLSNARRFQVVAWRSGILLGKQHTFNLGQVVQVN